MCVRERERERALYKKNTQTSADGRWMRSFGCIKTGVLLLCVATFWVVTCHLMPSYPPSTFISHTRELSLSHTPSFPCFLPPSTSPQSSTLSRRLGSNTPKMSRVWRCTFMYTNVLIQCVCALCHSSTRAAAQLDDYPSCSRAIFRSTFPRAIPTQTTPDRRGCRPCD